MADRSRCLVALFVLGVGGSGASYEARRDGTAVSSSGMLTTDGFRALASSSLVCNLSMRVSSVET